MAFNQASSAAVVVASGQEGEGECKECKLGSLVAM